MKKLLVVAIMILFISVSVIPSTGTTDVKQITVPTSNGNTFYVGGNGSGNYTKIQDAIDNASDGDTVYVYNGTYYENVVVDKSINLIGEDRETTVIAGQELNDGVAFFADGLILSGFTIRKCKGEPSKFYAGIRIHSNNSIINNNNIRENDDYGIYLERSSENNVISENYIAFNGIAGIFASTNSNSNHIFNNIIEYNDAFYTQGGIELVSSHNNFIENNSISNNYCGIILYDSFSNKISNNSIVNNSRGLKIVRGKLNFVSCNNFTGGYGIVLHETVDNFIINNTVTKSSVGVILTGAEYNKIAENEITNNYNGIRIYSGSNVNIIKDNIIKSNSNNGIFLERAGEHNIILRNAICNNNLHGIYSNASNRNIFCYNNITLNKRIGMNITWKSNSNTIKHNKLSYNLEGINVSKFSNYSHIFHNNFHNNNIHAYDEWDNIWDNDYPSGGNYWDDYNGTDGNGDGIGDAPYSIPGGDNEDRYPLMFPYINHGPPDSPIIGGPDRGKSRREYKYIFIAIDPDGDDVKYLIDWGDNNTECTGYNPSGTDVKVNHTWHKKGTYIVRCKAIDVFGNESDWAYLEVTMPKNQQAQNMWFLRWLERFPRLCRLLDVLGVNLGSSCLG